jgi:hypothetical protein
MDVVQVIYNQLSLVFEFGDYDCFECLRGCFQLLVLAIFGGKFLLERVCYLLLPSLAHLLLCSLLLVYTSE